VLPDRALAASAIGTPPERLTPLEAGGYTRSRTWLAQTQDGSVFLKEAADKGSLAMLRREAIVYANVSGSFLPALVGFADDGDRAVLALEYLSGVHWPPPYPDDVSPLFAALEQASAASPPPELPVHGNRHSRWERIAADPEPLLGLGVCSAGWLEQSLDGLAAAEAQADFQGGELVHNDVYSGNVCFKGDAAVLVDWGTAVRGSRWIDVAFALLSVRAEGGVLPPLDFPAEPFFAAALSGHLATEAPTAAPEWASPGSTLREDMKADLVHALRWTAEKLELQPLR
jgi:Phosphotransferase enzyme family